MTRLYECLGCKGINEVPFNPGMSHVEFKCHCGTINQAILAKPARLAGTCKAWVSLSDYVDFFLGNRPTLLLTAEFQPGRVAANIRACDIGMFIHVMMQKTKKEGKEGKVSEDGKDDTK